MKRNLKKCSEKTYDVAIIGGGIYGAQVARDASLRGLKVALFEQGDFGNATSANSQKIIHGGLRYLQHGNFPRMRESIRERSILMRIAPHLIFPMPFLIPLYAPFWKRAMMGIALKLNDLIGFDRNKHLASDKRIPEGRLISKTETLEYAPTLNSEGLNGGMLFYDAQVQNPDRLTLSLLLSAAESGADILNYAQVDQFRSKGNAITGLQVKDVLTGISENIRSKLTINCSGPWIKSIFNLIDQNALQKPKAGNLFKAIILVSRPLFKKAAVGLSAREHYIDNSELISKGYRYLFVTPWRNTSLIGTFYFPFEGNPDDFRISEQEILIALGEINEAFPEARLQREDIYFVYGGLLPRADGGNNQKDIQYAKHYKLRDHARENGIGGFISVEGVKYTTARDVAEKTVDFALKKLGTPAKPCQTKNTPIYGGDIENLSYFVKNAIKNKADYIKTEILEHLIYTYGTQYPKIMEYCKEDPSLLETISDQSKVIKAEVLHAMRSEMAQKLSDVVFRRTELGTAGFPGNESLNICAQMMRDTLQWDEQKMLQELKETKALFSNMEPPE